MAWSPVAAAQAEARSDPHPEYAEHVTNRITSLMASRSRLATLLALVVTVIVAACKGGGSSGY
jgi:hypothetical protein